MRPGRALLAAALTIVAAVVLAVALDGREAYVEAPPWSVVLVLGAAITGGLLVADRARAARGARATATARRVRDERRALLLRLDHELKNPLAVARIELANLRARTPDAGRDPAAVALEAAVMRMSRLVAGLRRLADLGATEVERRDVDVGALLTELVDDLDSGPVDVTLTLPRAPWPLPSVPGDRDLLALALENVLANAVKFARSGDAVEVRAVDADDHVLVEVADTGRGIPTADQDAVWSELARAGNGRDVPGNGIGLALVRAVADLHGARATLRSREGQGTLVRLELPR